MSDRTLRKQQSEEDDEKPSHFRRCIKVTKSGLRDGYNAVLNPESITVFFFWSMVMFLVCACFIVVYSAKANSFFCSVDPRAKDGGAPDTCKDCGGKSLMCAKEDECWRQAVNLTIQLNSTLTTDDYYQKFREAALDDVCNDLVASSGSQDPIEMIRSMLRYDLDVAASGSGTLVGSSCTEFHCAVLQNALTLTDIFRFNGDCTNTHGTKSEARAGVCLCDRLVQYHKFTAYILNSSYHTNSMSEEMTGVYSYCTEVIDYMRLMCDMEGASSNYPIWCTQTTTTTTTSTVTSTTTTLGPTPAPTSAPTAAPTPAPTAAPTPAPTPARRLQAADSPAAAVHDRSPSPAKFSKLARLLAIKRARRLQEPTASPSVSADNTKLPSYQVGSYGACQCIQQCQPGVKTRSVDCEANSCKQPEPQKKKSCDCGHCAECNVIPALTVQMYIYFVQTAIAAISFLCYLFIRGQTQEDFIELSCGQMILGFFFKKVPPLVKVGVIIQVFLVIYVAFSTFGVKPLAQIFGRFNEDCIRSTDTKVMTLVIGFIWVLQVLFGHIARKTSRRPDWLVTPGRHDTNKVFKIWYKCFKNIGP